MSKITKSHLRERGWTDGLIKRLLGKPDELESNPNYRSGPPMQLYLLDRVEAIEAEHRAELDDVLRRRTGRTRAAKKAVKTKHKKTIQQSLDVIRPLERLEMSELIRQACANYNELPKSEENYGAIATPDSNKDFLDRICVNYLRHRLTGYDSAIINEGRIGREDAYRAVRCKVLDQIAETYPELLSECQKQMRN